MPVRNDDGPIPENRSDGQSDPFCMDVYDLGNLIRENFVQVRVIMTDDKNAENFIIEIPRI